MLQCSVSAVAICMCGSEAAPRILFVLPTSPCWARVYSLYHNITTSPCHKAGPLDQRFAGQSRFLCHPINPQTTTAAGYFCNKYWENTMIILASASHDIPGIPLKHKTHILLCSHCSLFIAKYREFHLRVLFILWKS